MTFLKSRLVALHTFYSAASRFRINSNTRFSKEPGFYDTRRHIWCGERASALDDMKRTSMRKREREKESARATAEIFGNSAVDKIDTWLYLYAIPHLFDRAHADRPTFASIVLDTAFIHSVDRSGVRLAPPNPPINIWSTTGDLRGG